MAELMFSKAGKGYNREEVDSFLTELNRIFSDKEASLRDEIKQLTARLADTERRFAESEQVHLAKEEELTEAYKQKENECAAMEAALGQRIVLADEAAAKILVDANAEAEQIKSDARKAAAAEQEKLIDETRKHCFAVKQSVNDLAFSLNEIQKNAEQAEAMMNRSLDSARRTLPGLDI